MKTVDLWLNQAHHYMDIALEQGFRKFTWHMTPLWNKKMEIFSWARANTAAYGPLTIMLIDHSGAFQYNTYGRYEKPEAVYPTWSPDEGWDELIELMKTNVADNPYFTDNDEVPSQFRPVKGQRHRVVIHRLPIPGQDRDSLILQLRQLQLAFPNVEIFLSGCAKYSDLFGMGFAAVDFMPATLTVDGIDEYRVALPSGRNLKRDSIVDPRYKDWFELLGYNQSDIVDKYDRILFCLLSAQWAARYWNNITPFVSRRSVGTTAGNSQRHTVFMPSEYNPVSPTDFVLPAARRRTIRNVGLNLDEYDQFTCDTCILHNACTLYREGSVCTVKGSETVALADAFGSRNADVIIGGLSKLLQRNAERLEDAMAAEQASGELDPEVTKLGKTVFDQGVKLAKLYDPNLAGGPKVQVNVGVAAGGAATINASSPKQMTAAIVAELEATGVKREDIDSKMIAGVLRNMAQTNQQQAVTTAAVQYANKDRKTIEGSTS